MTTYICMACQKKVALSERPIKFFCKSSVKGHDWRILTNGLFLKYRDRTVINTPILYNN
jgi:hypothetical protein